MTPLSVLRLQPSRAGSRATLQTPLPSRAALASMHASRPNLSKRKTVASKKTRPVAQSRPFNVFVFHFWSIFSHGSKRLTFYFWVLWASERHNQWLSFLLASLCNQAKRVPSNRSHTLRSRRKAKWANPFCLKGSPFEFFASWCEGVKVCMGQVGIGMFTGG